MRLTNRELEAVSTALYNNISVPKKERNKKLIDELDISNHPLYKINQYIVKFSNEFSSLQEKISELKKTAKEEYPDCDTWNLETNDFNHFKKSQMKVFEKELKLEKVPTQKEIEDKIILSNVKDISELMENIEKEFE